MIVQRWRRWLIWRRLFNEDDPKNQGYDEELINEDENDDFERNDDANDMKMKIMRERIMKRCPFEYLWYEWIPRSGRRESWVHGSVTKQNDEWKQIIWFDYDYDETKMTIQRNQYNVNLQEWYCYLTNGKERRIVNAAGVRLNKSRINLRETDEKMSRN